MWPQKNLRTGARAPERRSRHCGCVKARQVRFKVAANTGSGLAASHHRENSASCEGAGAIFPVSKWPQFCSFFRTGYYAKEKLLAVESN